MVYEELAEELIEVGRNLMRSDNSRKVIEFIQGEAPVLDFLCKNTDRKIYPKDLSENLAMTPPRIARLLKNLAKKELIERSTDQTDTRRSIIKITDKGIKDYSKRKDEVLTIVANQLKKSGVEDSTQFVELFKKTSGIS